MSDFSGVSGLIFTISADKLFLGRHHPLRAAGTRKTNTSLYKRQVRGQDARRMMSERECMKYAETRQDRLRRVSSRSNALVKTLRQAATRGEASQDGLVALEGVRLVEEALRSGLRLRAIFFRESAAAAAKRLLPQVSGKTEALMLPDEVFAGASGTENPQGVAALAEPRKSSPEEMLKGE